MNQDLINTLQALLTAAENGDIDNLLYFSQLNSQLLVGQAGDIGIETLDEIAATVEELMIATVNEEPNGARRLVRL